MRDSRVPKWMKVGAVAGAVLIVSPLNILGDIPFIGIFDDVAMLGLLANFFVRTAEKSITRSAAPLEPPPSAAPRVLPSMSLPTR